jgi:hypothetical protein
MVIPKMARPAGPARLQITKPAEATPALEPAPIDIDLAGSLLARPEGSFLARYWRWIAVGVVAVASISISLSNRATPKASPAGQIESSISGGWTRSSLSAPGRVVSVYDPTRSETDYRVEFSWTPDALGVGWLFRVRDANNYYGARISQLQPGTSSALVAEHFEVVAGVETAHTRRVIPLARTNPQTRIRMDVIGPAFTLWVEGTPADYWTDARLNSGPFGFYDERGQRPTLQTVRFTFLQKGASRVAVTSFR